MAPTEHRGQEVGVLQQPCSETCFCTLINKMIKNEISDTRYRKSNLHLQTLCQRFNPRRPERKTSLYTREVLSYNTLSHCLSVHGFTLWWHAFVVISMFACFRFDATEGEMNVDKIQKSDSDSLSIWNQDDYCWPLGKSQISPCRESFTKWTSEEMKPQRGIKGDLPFPLTIYLLLHFLLFLLL